MVKVFSHDPFVAVVIKLENTWGTEVTPFSTGSYKVPFTSEDFHLDIEEFPVSEEFGALGGVLGVDTGRESCVGSLTVEPTYNTAWWWKLFSQVWGTENIVQDRSIWDATTAVTNLNTHIWTPGTELATGMSMRVWLGGPGPAASSTFLMITGLVITRMVWNQPRNARCNVTFDFIGKTLAPLPGTGETIPALASATKVKAIDFTSVGSRTHGSIKIGATLADFNTMGFTLTVDKKIELTDNYLQTLTTTDKPGIVGTREITLEIDTDLEQDFNTAGKPFPDFVSKSISSVVINYDSGVTAVSPEEYNFSFQIPAIRWTDVRPQATNSGPLQMPITGRAQMGPLTNLDAPFNAHTVPPGSTLFDIRALCHTTFTEDADAKWSAKPDATALPDAV